MARISAIAGISVASYDRDLLHANDRIWVEKNCYVDVWIELIHALGLESRAILPFTVAIDFLDDQWTFFKPPHDELRELYGFDVQELNVWRPLIDHVTEHLRAGRLVSTEADAYWLPDTAGTDYRRQHTKSTIVIAEIDVENRRLGYFHNAGYFELGDEDFARTFRIGEPASPEFMPLFAEVISIDRLVRHDAPTLRRLSARLWQKHSQQIPATNPVQRFKARLARDVVELQSRGLPHYHAWAFANTRQLGSAFELAGLGLAWLNQSRGPGSEELSRNFYAVASECKTFILKAARTVSNKKPLDLDGVFANIETQWEAAVRTVRQLSTSEPTRETA